MGMFNKLFKRNTVGLCERHIEAIMKVFERMPDAVKYITTSDGRKIPKLYHAIALLMRQRNISFSEIEAIRGKLHFQMSRKVARIPGGPLVISKGALLEASCDAVFYFDVKNPTTKEVIEFRVGMAGVLAEFAEKYSWDLDEMVNVSFLQETFRIIEMGVDAWGDPVSDEIESTDLSGAMLGRDFIADDSEKAPRDGLAQEEKENKKVRHISIVRS